MKLYYIILNNGLATKAMDNQINRKNHEWWTIGLVKLAKFCESDPQVRSFWAFVCTLVYIPKEELTLWIQKNLNNASCKWNRGNSTPVYCHWDASFRRMGVREKGKVWLHYFIRRLNEPFVWDRPIHWKRYGNGIFSILLYCTFSKMSWMGGIGFEDWCMEIRY